MANMTCLLDERAAALAAAGVCAFVDPATTATVLYNAAGELVKGVAISAAAVAAGQIVEVGCLLLSGTGSKKEAKKGVHKTEIAVIMVLPQAAVLITSLVLGGSYTSSLLSTAAKVSGWIKNEEDLTVMYAFSHKLSAVGNGLLSGAKWLLR